MTEPLVPISVARKEAKRLARESYERGIDKGKSETTQLVTLLSLFQRGQPVVPTQFSEREVVHTPSTVTYKALDPVGFSGSAHHATTASTYHHEHPARRRAQQALDAAKSGEYLKAARYHDLAFHEHDPGSNNAVGDLAKRHEYAQYIHGRAAAHNLAAHHAQVHGFHPDTDPGIIADKVHDEGDEETAHRIRSLGTGFKSRLEWDDLLRVKSRDKSRDYGRLEKDDNGNDRESHTEGNPEDSDEISSFSENPRPEVSPPPYNSSHHLNKMAQEKLTEVLGLPVHAPKSLMDRFRNKSEKLYGLIDEKHGNTHARHAVADALVHIPVTDIAPEQSVSRLAAAHTLAELHHTLNPNGTRGEVPDMGKVRKLGQWFLDMLGGDDHLYQQKEQELDENGQPIGEGTDESEDMGDMENDQEQGSTRRVGKSIDAYRASLDAHIASSRSDPTVINRTKRYPLSHPANLSQKGHREALRGVTEGDEADHLKAYHYHSLAAEEHGKHLEREGISPQDKRGHERGKRLNEIAAHAHLVAHHNKKYGLREDTPEHVTSDRVRDEGDERMADRIIGKSLPQSAYTDSTGGTLVSNYPKSQGWVRKRTKQLVKEGYQGKRLSKSQAAKRALQESKRKVKSTEDTPWPVTSSPYGVVIDDEDREYHRHPDGTFRHGGKIEWCVVGSIQCDPEKLQYKEFDGQDGLSEERRSEEFKLIDPMKVPPIALWKDDKHQSYVVDGHKRLAKFKEAGFPVIRAFHISAKDHEEAKAIGEKMNEKRGTKSMGERESLFHGSEQPRHVSNLALDRTKESKHSNGGREYLRTLDSSAIRNQLKRDKPNHSQIAQRHRNIAEGHKFSSEESNDPEVKSIHDTARVYHLNAADIHEEHAKRLREERKNKSLPDDTPTVDYGTLASV